MSELFGSLFQLGHVVPAIDPAVQVWKRAGVLEWQIVRDYPVLEWRYRNAVVEIPIDVAIAWSGSVQIELIAPRDSTPSMYREYLALHPAGGLQHFGYRPEDYNVALERALAAGWTYWLGGRVDAKLAFAYLRPPDESSLVLPAEISGEVGSAREHA
jgi:NADPH2:quinone reductase